MIIEAIVKTKQRESKIEMLENGVYKISVKSLPIENKANIEIIKMVSKYFNVAQKNISIKTGKNTSRKIIEIL